MPHLPILKPKVISQYNVYLFISKEVYQIAPNIGGLCYFLTKKKMKKSFKPIDSEYISNEFARKF